MARVSLHLVTLPGSAAASGGYQFQIAPPYHVRATKFLSWKCTVQDKLTDPRVGYAQFFRRLLSRYELARVHVPSFTMRFKLTQSLELEHLSIVTGAAKVNHIRAFKAAWLSFRRAT
jgi:hypothetical protein